MKSLAGEGSDLRLESCNFCSLTGNFCSLTGVFSILSPILRFKFAAIITGAFEAQPLTDAHKSLFQFHDCLLAKELS